MAGLLIGAFGGALVGKAIDQGLDEDVIKQVEADMQLAAELIDADKVDAVTAVIADVSAVDSD